MLVGVHLQHELFYSGKRFPLFLSKIYLKMSEKIKHLFLNKSEFALLCFSQTLNMIGGKTLVDKGELKLYTLQYNLTVLRHMETVNQTCFNRFVPCGYHHHTSKRALALCCCCRHHHQKTKKLQLSTAAASVEAASFQVQALPVLVIMLRCELAEKKETIMAKLKLDTSSSTRLLYA